MVLEMRIHRDYFAGNLSLQALSSDTTLTSTAFAALGTSYSTGLYMPIVLHNPATGAYEVVYIVGHSAASNTVTVQRGKEGTSAQAWPLNTQIIDAPTYRDLVASYTRAALPADPHLGMRALVTDESFVVARALAGWMPAMGIANPGAVGPNRAGSNPPNSAVLTHTMGNNTALSPDGSGQVSVTWRAAFPTACIGATAWSIDFTRFIGWCTTVSESTTGATFRLTTVSGGALVSQTAGPVSLGFAAVGY